jgi:hypothetical protein
MIIFDNRPLPQRGPRDVQMWDMRSLPAELASGETKDVRSIDPDAV